MPYRTFVRNWYKMINGKLEPYAGRKTYIDYNLTEVEARRACQNYNNTHNPGKLSRKMEYESY